MTCACLLVVHAASESQAKSSITLVLRFCLSRSERHHGTIIFSFAASNFLVSGEATKPLVLKFNCNSVWQAL